MGIKFIAAQNPMENTLNSFWLMIINHKVSLVILFSYTFVFFNDKYIQYWPKETNTPLTIAGVNNVKYTIKLTSQMDVIEKLCQENKVYSYLHTGFWQCMDTLREKNQLEDLWNSGKALWKIW